MEIHGVLLPKGEITSLNTSDLLLREYILKAEDWNGEGHGRIWVNIHYFHCCCASGMIRSKNTVSGVIISKQLWANKQENINIQIIHNVWAQRDFLPWIFFSAWYSTSILAIGIEMFLLFQGLSEGTFFPFQHLFGMWPQPPRTLRSVLVCFGCIRQEQSWEVYFSVMRCGAVSQRRGKEQKQPVPSDPVTLWVFT